MNDSDTKFAVIWLTLIALYVHIAIFAYILGDLCYRVEYMERLVGVQWL